MWATWQLSVPGWKWSESVKPIAGTDSCQVAHMGYQVSVIHSYGHSPRNLIPHVGDLATVCAGDWLNGFGPLPSRLKRGAHCLHVAEIYDFDSSFADVSCFVRTVKTFLDRCCFLCFC